MLMSSLRQETNFLSLSLKLVLVTLPSDYTLTETLHLLYIYFCFIDSAKTSACVDHNKLENSSRDGNTRQPYLPPEKSVCRLGSNS